MIRLGYQLYDWVGLTPQEIQVLAKAKNMSFDVDSFEKIVESAQLKKRREISAGLWPPAHFLCNLASPAVTDNLDLKGAISIHSIHWHKDTISCEKKWSGTKLHC